MSSSLGAGYILEPCSPFSQAQFLAQSLPCRADSENLTGGLSSRQKGSACSLLLSGKPLPSGMWSDLTQLHTLLVLCIIPLELQKKKVCNTDLIQILIFLLAIVFKVILNFRTRGKKYLVS